MVKYRTGNVYLHGRVVVGINCFAPSGRRFGSIACNLSGTWEFHPHISETGYTAPMLTSVAAKIESLTENGEPYDPESE